MSFVGRTCAGLGRSFASARAATTTAAAIGTLPRHVTRSLATLAPRPLAPGVTFPGATRPMARLASPHGMAHFSTSSGPVQAQATGAPAITTEPTAVSVRFADGSTSSFHHIWLRDHCLCPACLHPETLQRTVDTFSLAPEQLQAASIRLVPPTGDAPAQMEITWAGSDAHVSLFPLAWLQTHAYDQRATNYQRDLITDKCVHHRPAPCLF
ncbi:hypothetical protein H696_02254 [Fonticula alba]|uniref:Gamma-butyrobetaine hydroxylase-like N-terminal domain-containing protein n=1 Tax=Fonticula alba TaxID=691883 RepID=A0A058ZBL1_FONAL|nr:hypothetical protein H696_02254 [Fonticula alba]KCV71308.1 hypothetical protein H696_02254 [Fonticula alba]|eukprot:XP_009494431.1 hypothetical protein H696_02254 [Fonticula alba]